MDQSPTALLENDNISFTIEKQPGCRVVFHATIKKPLIDKARKEAVRKAARQIDIPGFRKGAASEVMLRQRAPDLLRKTLEETITSLGYQECQSIHFVQPVRPEPQVVYKCESLDDTQGRFDITFETRPEIPAIDSKMLAMPEAAIQPVPPVDFAKEAEIIGEWFASYIPIEGRSAQLGDFATLDVIDLSTEPATPIFKQERFLLEEGRVGKWVLDGVLGMDIGAEKETVAFADPGSPDAHLFPDKNVKITLHALSLKQYPTEEKLVELLKLDNVQQLHEKMTLLHERRHRFETGQKARQELVEQILAKFPFEVPHSMIEQEVRVRLDEMFKHEKTRQALLAKSEDEKKAFIAQMEKDAYEAIALHCLCLRYKESHGLELKEDALKEQHPILAMMEILHPTTDKEPADLNKEFSRHLIATVCDHLLSVIVKP